MTPSYKDIVYQTPEQPRQLRLDTTCVCNASCLSCHRFHSKRVGQMTQSQINGILADVANWQKPLTEIIPVNYGEFFIRSDWYEILVMISKVLPRTQIVIPTNGSRLTKEGIEQLCHIPTISIVNFSLNAYFDETYKAFMGLDPEVLHVMEAKIRLLKALRPDIIQWVSFVHDPQYQTDLERDLFKEKWQGLVNGVQILPAASASRMAKEAIIRTGLPCRSIFSDLVVGFDGKLSSCCFDSSFSLDLAYSSGDILADWKNEKLETLRRLHNEHRRNEIELCFNCTFA